MTRRFKQTEIGKIPEDWEIRLLKDVGVVNEVSIDASYSHNQIEYIDISSVDRGTVLETKLIQRDKAPSRAQRVVRNSDILLSTVRPNLKHFAFMKNVKPNTIASTGFAVITSKNIQPQFLYYYLSTDRYTDYLSTIADMHTSAYPACNPDVIENSLIPYPPFHKQCAIAKILGDLDEKIELNRQMNKTLESIAQAIFKHWFVDFEFPNENGKPYKSSGGKMVESELGVIPAEWQIRSILDVAHLLSGGTPRTEVREFWNGDVPWVSARDVTTAHGTYIVNTEKYITQVGIANSNAKILPQNTTVITARGTVGNCCILGRNMTINQTNYGLKARQDNWDLFVFFMVLSVVDRMKQDAYGTVFDTITTQTLRDLHIPIPPSPLVELFDRKANALMRIILQNIKENCVLIQIRDFLLPKLMIGEIKVEE